jgi:hypothetical protein
MDGNGDHYVKPDSERQIAYVLSDMWNLDLKLWHKGETRKKREDKREGDMGVNITQSL